MKLMHRRAIYIFFVAIFLVAAPLIVFYTMGYRYNLDKGRVQKTGVIKITTLPRGADIYLNGVKYEAGQTPAKAEYMLPGDYEIRLTKDGYFDWQKKLAVAENGTTFAEKIMLFKKSTPTLISQSTTAAWLVSPDQNMIAQADSTGHISLIDINSGLLGEVSGGNIETIATISDAANLQFIGFSPSGRYLLAQSISGKTVNNYLIDTILKTSRKISAAQTQIKWSGDRETIYALDKAGLWQIDLASLTTKISVAKISANDFFVSGNALYTLTDSALIKSELNGANTSTVASVSGTGGKINAIRNNRALITQPQNGVLQIVDLNQKMKTITSSAKAVTWLSNNSFIFYNDFEISIFSLADNYPELITRVGTKITAATWHPAGKHLIFSSDGKIKIIELDNREFRNITEINTGSADYLAVDRSGNNLYFYGESAGKIGSYKLNLQ